jgi:hypothetical protein
MKSEKMNTKTNVKSAGKNSTKKTTGTPRDSKALPVAIIRAYVDLKKKEKNLSDLLNQAKPAFTGACAAVSIQIGQECFTVNAACIYATYRKTYDYMTSPVIADLVQKLEGAKAQYEAEHAPVNTSRSWSVKFNGTEKTGV